MHRQQALGTAGREILNGAQGQPVKPRFESQAFGLFASIAKCARDGFVDDFFLGNRVGCYLFGCFAEVEFAFNETLQTAEAGIYISTDVLGGGCGYPHRGDCVFERNLRLGIEIRDPATLPFVRAPQ